MDAANGRSSNHDAAQPPQSAFPVDDDLPHRGKFLSSAPVNGRWRL
jgi:hypothetical protein